jgi:hypothetical protein
MSTRYIGGLVYNPPGGWSGSFSGSNYLTVPNNAALNVGSSAFTLECWFYNQQNLLSGSEAGVGTIAGKSDFNGSNSNGYTLFCYDGNNATPSTNLRFFLNGVSFFITTPANAVPFNAWTHVAVVKSGTTCTIYCNGIASVTSSSAPSTVNDTSTVFTSGSQINGTTWNGTYRLSGLVSNLRLVKGTAVYTANFTPPTAALLPITNTQLLTCRYPTFVDGSTNAFTITNVGTVTVSTSNPFPTTVLPNPALGGAGNGIYTLSQYASLRGAGTWPAIDPYYKNVAMNLHGNAGAVLPFNTDASTNNFQVTQVGDTKPSNLTPFIANGYWSNILDGSGDYLTTSSSSALALSGNFTVEAWLYLNSYPSTSAAMYVCDFRNGSTNNFGFGVIGTSGVAKPYMFVGSGPVETTCATSLSLNTWYHLAMVRSGSTVTYYLNGVSDGTMTTSFSQGTTAVTIGARYTGATEYVNGYLSNVRVVNGTAVYTGTFTPPTTPLTAITNTALLTCQSNRFVDNSTNALTITPSGNAAVNPFQPFTAPTGTSAYGSGFFDGTGDWLSLTSSSTALPTGTQDFSVEMWLYWQTQGGTYPQIISNPVTNGFQIYYDIASGLLAVGIFNVSNVITYTIAQTALSGAWTHLVVTRSGNTFRMFVNGVLRSNGTNSISFASLSTQYIGSDGSRPYTGYISNVRNCLGSIPTSYQTSSTTNGTSVFSSPTDPVTTSSQGASNTSLLTVQTNAPSQNNTFLDSSTNNFTITRNGNTTQGTFSPYGPNGYWSVSFSGAQTSPSLTYPSISAYDLGATSQFTYECWVYFASVSGEQSIFERFTGTSGPGWLLTKLSTNVYRAHFGTSVYIDTGAIAVAGQWIHLAVSRDGSTGSLFVDGVRQATTSSVVNFSDGTDPLVFGERNSGSQTFPFNGYISNARIVKSTYVYNPSSTTITVPTSPLTAITNTVFLGLQSNRYVDNSSNNATATASSASSVQRFSPFSPTTAYSTSVIGGSGYFDGSGDYLTAANNAAFKFSGNFTVECFVYSLTATGGSNYSGIFDTRSGNVVSTTSANINFKPDGYLNIYVGGTNAASSTLLGANQWVHVAMVRSGSTVTLYQNGVSVATVTTSANLNDGYCTIGGFIADGYFNGYISNTRVVNGTAVYTAAFTPPTAPLTAITNTSLLLNYTNAGILDNAMMNDLETVGNAQISTSVKKYGSASMYFDGSGDSLSQPSNPAYIFSTGNLTIEAWIYFNSVANGTWVTTNVTSGFYWQYFSSAISFGRAGGGTDISKSWVPLANAWYHVATVRSGSTVTHYVNGISIGSGTFTDSISATTTLQIGTGGAGSFNGYIDDLRITRVARYTANFQPPTSQVQDQ